jgi:hypothetical protein
VRPSNIDASAGSVAELERIVAQIRVSVRKVWISPSESDPGAELFRQILANLQAIPQRAGAP